MVVIFLLSKKIGRQLKKWVLFLARESASPQEAPVFRNRVFEAETWAAFRTRLRNDHPFRRAGVLEIITAR